MNKLPAATGVAVLDEAWLGIEKSFHELGQLIRDSTSGQDPRARFEGYRSALALLADNYVIQVYADRKRPEFLPYLGLVNNYAAPAPDFNYFMAQVKPGVSYRVWGTRGNSATIDVQQLAGFFGQNADLKGVRTLDNQIFDEQGITCAAGGGFEFIFGPAKPQGEYASMLWWKSDKDTALVMFREVFLDYAAEQESVVVHFQAIDGEQSQGGWSLDDAVHRLQSFGRAMKHYGFTFSMGKSFAGIGNNVFRSENFGGGAGHSGQAYLQARYEIPPGYAMVGQWTVPPKYSYWSVALYNDVYQTLDFVEHQVSLNGVQAHVGGNRAFTFVVSDFDPGIANWLDVDGHPTGVLLLRAKDCPGAVAPTVKLVAQADLDKSLPVDIKRVTAGDRQHDLDIRRKHYLCRTRR